MGEAVRLQLRNRLDELERMSAAVEDLAARHTLPPRFAFEVTLALDEILTNVISYGYEPGEEHEIHVQLSLDHDELQVRVEDDGRPFDPLSVPIPDIDLAVDERPIGGLGVLLVRRVMDRVEYRRESGKNILTMLKRVAPAATTS